MTDTAVDPEQNRKVIRWLAIGVAVIVLFIGVFFGVNAYIESQIVEPTPQLSDDDLAVAQVKAEAFITSAGTFGASDSTIASEAYGYALGLLTTNAGAYDNPDFGLSRAEAYNDKIIPILDTNGEEDDTDYFASQLDNYSPDWSGQLAKYGISNILITPGEAYEEKGNILLPMQVSFTSTLDLYKNSSSFVNGEGDWNHYRGEYFETVDLVLSYQAGDWLIWSISDLEDYPYLLNTWSTPDWRASSPNVSILEKVS